MSEAPQRRGPPGARGPARAPGAPRGGAPGGRPGAGGPRGRGGPGGNRRRRDDAPKVEWVPTTRLGKEVKEGRIRTMSDALASGLSLREPQIVDKLLPELEDEVLHVKMVQRMTDSGRRVRFSITAVTGNGDGFVGIGQAKGKEVGPTIRRAIDKAKINMIEVKRGAGSWQSGDGAPNHSVPFKVAGKCASTEVVIRPAPQGTGLVAGDVAKSVLKLAGVKDAWVFARGQTRTTTNYAKAVFDALHQLKIVHLTSENLSRMSFVDGPLEIKEEATEEEVEA